MVEMYMTLFKRYVQPLFSIALSELPVEKALRFQRVIFQARIWHALLHLITINVILPPHTNVSLVLHTSYDVLYGVGHAIVLSNKKRIRHYILFNCAVPIRIPFTVFKVMAIRATVSVWKKNGKRIKLNVLSIHSLFVFGAVSRLIYFSIQFCFCELSVLITSQIRPRILHFFHTFMLEFELIGFCSK